MFFFYCFGDSRVLHVLPHSSPSGRSAVLLPDGGGGRGGGRRCRGGRGGGRFVFRSLDDVALDVRHVALCGGQRRLLTAGVERSEEHTSELQSLMRISYAVFCLQKKITLQP